MTNKIARVAVALCALLHISAATAQPETDGWHLKRQRDDISVYTRAVDGSRFAEFRGTTTLFCSGDEFLALYRDADALTEWLYNVTSAELIEHESDDNFVTHTATRAPWPAKHRDSVVRSRIERDPTSGVITIRLSSEADAIATMDRHVRVQRLAGLWRLTPRDEGGLTVEYRAHVDPGGGLPAWLVNAFVVDAPFDTLRALRARLTAKN